MRTWLLRALVASIVLSAVLAAVALLSPEWGAVQWKTLGTSFAFSAASLNGMACATAWERRHHVAYAPGWGIVLSFLVFVLIAIALWAEPEASAYYRVTGSLAVAALVATHASLLRQVALSRGAELSGFVAIGAAVVLGLVIMLLIWGDDLPSANTGRFVGLLATLVAATTIATPIIHLLSRTAAHVGAASDVVAFCPRCGIPLGAPVGAMACRSCGARFEVRFEARSPSPGR